MSIFPPSESETFQQSYLPYEYNSTHFPIQDIFNWLIYRFTSNPDSKIVNVNGKKLAIVYGWDEETQIERLFLAGITATDHLSVPQLLIERDSEGIHSREVRLDDPTVYQSWEKVEDDLADIEIAMTGCGFPNLYINLLPLRTTPQRRARLFEKFGVIDFLSRQQHLNPKF